MTKKVTKPKPKPKPKAKEKKRVVHKPSRAKSHKPKLAIIIDDVHTQGQLSAIKALHLHITPSIFPPYSLAKHSNTLARGLKHLMIHLPMESGNSKFNSQSKTLMTSYSATRIAMRVAEIRTLFPNAKYINNHTGSVFTSDFKSMQRLYVALKRKGFVFIDSFTSSHSKVQRIVEDFGDRYLRRDVFIDNEHNVPYIHGQLQQLVKLAKKRGYAIGIGHPHKTTMQALQSAKSILKDVELVYIDGI